jgi:O-antigen/teichoic acid export membrane protein
MVTVSKTGSLTWSSGLRLLMSQISEALGPLLRSVAMAHLLSPTDFGIGLSMSIIAGLADMVLDFGIDRSAVRMVGKDSDTYILKTLHTLAVIRGLGAGLLIVCSGPYLAAFFKGDQAALAFSLMGGVPLIMGFGNLGVKQVTRYFLYAPDANATLMSQIVYTLLLVLFAYILQDYRCVLIGALASAVTYVIVSHAGSPIRWHLGWSGETAATAIKFGIPLIPNGTFTSIASLGDRLVVGSFLGPSALALYSATVAAAILPRGVILQFLGRLSLPIFVNHQLAGIPGHQPYDRWTIELSAVGFFYGLGFLVFGRPAIGIIFGSAFEPNQTFVSLVAIGISLKFGLALPVPPALALGDTRFVLFTSTLNIISLSLGTVLLISTKSLIGFVLGIAVGDCVANLIIVFASSQKYSFRQWLLWSMFVTCHILLLAGVIYFEYIETLSWAGRFSMFGILSLIFGSLAIAFWYSCVPNPSAAKR